MRKNRKSKGKFLARILFLLLSLLTVASTLVFIIVLRTLSPLVGSKIELIVLVFLIILSTLSSLVALVIFSILSKEEA